MFTKCPILTKRRAVALLLALGAALTCVIVLCSTPRGLFSTPDMLDVSGAEGRVKYLAAYGWEADISTETEKNVLIPRELTGALADYAEMQTKQGYDFADYAGLECRQFTYELTNYDYSGTVYAVVYVRGARVIGGDIHSAALNGFMHSLR